MVLSKEAILAAQDLKTETVKVPEWGGDVLVRTMMGVERDAFEQAMFDTKGGDARANMRNFRARLVASCVVDEAGNRMFGVEDVEALGAKSALALDRLYTVASRLNSISQQDVETLTKN